MKDFELCSHTADIKLRVYGSDLRMLFRNAVVGMFQVIKPHALGCHYKNERLVCDQLPKKHDVIVDSGDLQALLVDFLSKALYLSDVYNEAYLDANIHEITKIHIKATLLGVSIQGFEVVEIKAVTYHELTIVENADQTWQADIVFDI